MKFLAKRARRVALAICLFISLPCLAEVTGELSKDLAGTSLTYHYDSGRKYKVRFTADTMAYLRFDVPDRDWVEGVPYIARKLDNGVYLINWHRPERVEYVTIVYDFNKRLMYTSALLEGKERHFDSARIVELDRK